MRRPAALTWRRPALAYLLIVVLPAVAGLALPLFNARPVARPAEASGMHVDLIGVLLVTVPIVLVSAHLCGAIVHRVGQLGVILFMFGVGLELRTRALRHNGASAVVIGHAAPAVPFSCGILLGLFLPTSYQPDGAGRLPTGW